MSGSDMCFFGWVAENQVSNRVCATRGVLKIEAKNNDPEYCRWCIPCLCEREDAALCILPQIIAVVCVKYLKNTINSSNMIN